MQKRVILAVEPDERQAAQLSALIRRQFSEELVLAGSTSAALSKLQGRIPELVLTSALMRPRDEVALIQWLRELGEKAAHVQTVTIPVLASSGETQERKKTGGMTFVWDKPSVPSAPDSCDPAVFADWISVYLDLASSHHDDL